MFRVLAVGSVNLDHLVKLASARFLCSEAADFSVIRTSWEAALGWFRCLVTSQTPSCMILVLRDTVPCDLCGWVLEILCVYYPSPIYYLVCHEERCLPSPLVCLYQCDLESHLWKQVTLLLLFLLMFKFKTWLTETTPPRYIDSSTILSYLFIFLHGKFSLFFPFLVLARECSVSQRSSGSV